MPANWSNPVLSSSYTDVLSILKERDTDAATMNDSPTNPPTGYMRYNRTLDKFQEWDGAAWIECPISIAGGGTGAATAADARTNLGIGTMGTQSSSAVAITGGTLSGITSLAMAGDITLDANGTRSIGTNANKLNKIYVGNAVVLPVGADKYATS